MFTGIVQAIGTVEALRPRGGDVRLAIRAGALDLSRTAIGDSICVQGCCVTAVTLSGQIFEADLSRETLALTTLGTLAVGAPVNLEPALRAGDALGGHLVSGHVDGVSLTVNEVAGLRFGVNLIPHTQQVTTLGGLVAGARINLEIDQVARYVERLSVFLATSAPQSGTHSQRR